MKDVMLSDEIAALLKKLQHVALIKHPLVRQAAHDPNTGKALADLELQRLIDSFMLSPERQERFKNDTFGMTRPFNISL